MLEKTQVAASSMVAAIFLTSIKIVVGVLTGSLGILSEAAHSGLDLVAAVITLFAVRLADRPADATHPYGHGKVENLSALAEAAILVVTCLTIISEAIQRLLFKTVEIDVNLWAFGVVLLSIVIDFSRSRALKRAARKYDSQALEADALHFSTDIWSSAVVLVGLLLTKVGEWSGQGWLERADSLAALGVASIVVAVSLRLGYSASLALMDTAPRDLPAEVERRARMVDGVLDAKQVRVRRVGPASFVDMSIAVRRGATFEESHGIASAVEKAVKTVAPRAEVLVHVDPVAPRDESVVDTVRGLAARHELEVHNVHVQNVDGQLTVEFHVELDDSLTLQEAHALVSHLEDEVRLLVPNVAEVNSHLEPAGQQSSKLHAAKAREAALPAEVLDSARRAVGQIAREECGPEGYHHILLRGVNGEIGVVLHIFLADQSPIREAHDLSTRLETRLRQQIPHVGEVLVHVEPRSMAAPAV
ncbi:MAG: cation-efflux pump [Chloroflexi bacterium]|nr:cation-efflux pump [Chloroflexota bacterium]